MTETINSAVHQTIIVHPAVDIALGLLAAAAFVWIVNRILE